jgi:hypothetical protein
MAREQRTRRERARVKMVLVETCCTRRILAAHMSCSACQPRRDCDSHRLMPCRLHRRRWAAPAMLRSLHPTFLFHPNLPMLVAR